MKLQKNIFLLLEATTGLEKIENLIRDQQIFVSFNLNQLGFHTNNSREKAMSTPQP